MMKRIICTILCLTLMLTVLPVAEASNSGTINLQMSKNGYFFEMFQLATFNEETQTYTALATDPSVVSKISSINTQLASQTSVTDNQRKQIVESSNLVLACDECHNTSALGQSCGSWLTTGADKSFYSLNNGLYYVKCTGTPVADAVVLKNKIIVLMSSDVNEKLDDCVKDGSEPSVYFTFGDGSTKYKTVLSSETISYVVSADIMGTPSNKLEAFNIAVDLDSNIDLGSVSINSVQLIKGSNGADCAYTQIKNTSRFTVSLPVDELNKDTFYGYDSVVVQFTAKLVSNPTTDTKITSSSGLIYKFSNQAAKDVIGGSVSILATNTLSGTCGNNLTWSLNSNGTLIISGDGTLIPDSNWTTFVNNGLIKSVVIDGTVNYTSLSLTPKYTVTLKDGDTLIATNLILTDNITATKPATPTKDGYTFVG